MRALREERMFAVAHLVFTVAGGGAAWVGGDLIQTGGMVTFDSCRTGVSGLCRYLSGCLLEQELVRNRNIETPGRAQLETPARMCDLEVSNHVASHVGLVSSAKEDKTDGGSFVSY